MIDFNDLVFNFFTQFLIKLTDERRVISFRIRRYMLKTD